MNEADQNAIRRAANISIALYLSNLAIQRPVTNCKSHQTSYSTTKLNQHQQASFLNYIPKGILWIIIFLNPPTQVSL